MTPGSTDGGSEKEAANFLKISSQCDNEQGPNSVKGNRVINSSKRR